MLPETLDHVDESVVYFLLIAEVIKSQSGWTLAKQGRLCDYQSIEDASVGQDLSQLSAEFTSRIS